MSTTSVTTATATPRDTKSVRSVRSGPTALVSDAPSFEIGTELGTNGDFGLPKIENVTAEDSAIIDQQSAYYRRPIPITHDKTCSCKSSHLNCMSPKEWLKSQLGVWQFAYEKRDIRDKDLHPATFPISLSRKVIQLFTHEGELILDPFAGSGTSLLAAQELNRNAIGFDLQERYVSLSDSRLRSGQTLFGSSQQFAVQDDARNISQYIEKETLSLIWTSPPYANLLNRKRTNKSRRDRRNSQFGKVEQYSQDQRDLGTLQLAQYQTAMGDIFEMLLPLLRPKAHCVVNVPDMWWENERVTIHVSLIDELRKRGFELRNIIIWDRRNVVNAIGIFGWPSNYITMGVTFEYLLDFWRPA